VPKTPWKKAIKATAKQPYVDIELEDGKKYRLDLTPLITKRDAFWRLKNARYFSNVSIDLLGGLYWAEGEDISPTKMLCYQSDNI
jgi:hypothetical protein